MNLLAKPIVLLALFTGSAVMAQGIREDGHHISNSSVQRTFEDSMTLHRARMGLTNLNGVAYVAVTRNDLYGSPSSMRIGATNFATGNLDIQRFGDRVTSAHVYIDSGNAPIRVEKAPGKMVVLQLGALKATPSPSRALVRPLEDPRVQTISIGTVTNKGSATLKSVDVHVVAPAVEVLR